MKTELISVATYPSYSDRCNFQLEEFHKGSSRSVQPDRFRKYADEIENFKVRPKDVWVISFPRSGVCSLPLGSTWTQELVWLVSHQCNPKTTKMIQQIRFPNLEASTLPGMGEHKNNLTNLTYVPVPNMMKLLNLLPTRRFIKTHLAAGFLPKKIWTVKPKMIYVYRDPRDVAISNYHLRKGMWGYTESLETFLDAFLEDKVWNAPYWGQVLGYWKLRNEENTLFIRYSDLKKDPSQVVEKVAKFLGKEVNHKQMESTLEYLKIENMRVNPSVQIDLCGEPLIRKGESGKWKEVMSEEYANKFEKWIQENVKGTGFVP